MFYKDIKDVMPEKNIVCVSPHYDDFLFFLGGYFFEMKRCGLLDTKNVTNISTFSRTNYQERDAQGNKRTDLKRVQYATGIRIIEDLECLDALLGLHNYGYRVFGEEESIVRGKGLNEGDGEMEMSFGSYETMDEKDEQALSRIKEKLKEFIKEDTAIVLPLSMKGHIDHFLAREAGLSLAKESGASVYFAEDKPYAGLMNEQETKINQTFIDENKLVDRAFAHHAKKVLEFAYTYYPSQIDTVYDQGIMGRNEYLKSQYGVTTDCDRIYKYER
ncbi:MAG: hypothetical protein RR625_03535 [Christensenellaceae bacterium]